MKNRLSIICCVVALLIPLPVASADHSDMSYQGRLTDIAGDPVVDGLYNVTFSLWDDSIGGTQLWSQTKEVQTSGGFFGTMLQHPFDYLFEAGVTPPDGPFYTQLQVGGDSPMTPRTRMSAVYSSILTHRMEGDMFTSPGVLIILPEGGQPPDNQQPIASIRVESQVADFTMLHRSSGTDDSSYMALSVGGDAGAVEVYGFSEGVDAGSEGTSGSRRGQRNSSTDRFFSASDVETHDASGISKTVDSVYSDQVQRLTTSSDGSGDSSEIAQKVTPTSLWWRGLTKNAAGDSSLISLTGNSAKSSLNIYGGIPPDDSRPQLHAVSDTGGSQLWLGSKDNTGGSSLPMVGMNAGSTAQLNIAFGGPPDDGSTPPDDGKPSVRMGIGDVGSLVDIYGGIPPDDTQPQAHIMSDTGSAGFWLGSVDGSGGGSSLPIVSMEAGATSKLNIAFGNPPDDTKPGLELGATDTQSLFEMHGPDPGAAGDQQVISMFTDGANARVGIGTDTSSEALFVVGNIIATGSITAITDTKAKEDVSTVEQALDKVMALRGVTYNLKRAEYPELKFSAERQLGFLADEVEEVVPQVVIGGGKDLKAVDYGRLTPLLVEAIKEQQAQIDLLKQEVLELKEAAGKR